MARKKIRGDKRHRHSAPPRQAVRGGMPNRAGPGWKPAADPDELALRDRILEFTYQSRFGKDFERAMSRFWGAEALRSRVFVEGEPEIAAFQEWYIHDFITREGERIIDLFSRKVGPSLPPRQRSMLEDWRQSNRLRLLEVQDVMPGVGETVQDLLGDEVLKCWDISTSYAARQWQLLVARSLITEGRWYLSGAGLILSPFDKDHILEYSQGLWNEYQREHPGADILDFYRDRSLELYRFAKKLQEDPAMLHPTTPEGHPVVTAVAEYRVRDADEIARRLDQAEEFEYTGPDAEHPHAEHYVWLLRGRSFVPEAAEMPKKGLQLAGELTRGPGQPRYRTLGDITLWPRRLELACLSQERLEAGKTLLEKSTWVA